MIMSLFRKRPVQQEAAALYAAAVEQARAVPFYADFGVPDTVEGRFEQITLHVYLILRVLKGQGPQAKKLSQALFDVMFQNMDDGLRELGVGDLSVGKKIRKLAENFYGRIGAYEAALADDAGNADLAKALGRNIFEDETAPAAAALAGYMRIAAALIEAQPIDDILLGRILFPKPERGA